MLNKWPQEEKVVGLALGLPWKDAGGEVSSNAHALVTTFPSATHSRNYGEGFRGCQDVTQAISGVPGMLLWGASSRYKHALTP